MKSAVLKFLAFSGIAIAAYPVVTTFRATPVSSELSPDIASSSPSALVSPPPASQRPATALTLTPTPQNANPLGLGNFVVIRPDANGHFVTKAMINGITIPLMFDTGATIVALSFEDAIKLGMHISAADFRSQVQTANGLAPAAEFTLKDIRIDGISVENVPAMVLPPGKLETSLLGRSFWGRLKTGFSYAAGNLILKN
jgi:aspartyl protease family protein